MTIVLHDQETGLFPTVAEVEHRFVAAASVEGIDPAFARSVFRDALAGDRSARELVEQTMGVEFL